MPVPLLSAMRFQVKFERLYFTGSKWEILDDYSRAAPEVVCDYFAIFKDCSVSRSP